MILLEAMQELKQNLPQSIITAQNFLDTLDLETQQQLIAAIYLGREHIHVSTLRNDVMPMNRDYVEHIHNDEYANIIYEKGLNIITYLNKLEECAKNSNFDLNKI